VAEKDSPSFLKFPQHSHALGHLVIQFLPLSTKHDLVDFANLEMLNEIFDLLFRSERWRNTRQTNSPIGDCCLTTKILLPDCNYPLCFGDEQVHCKRCKEVCKYDIHPEVVGIEVFIYSMLSFIPRRVVILQVRHMILGVPCRGLCRVVVVRSIAKSIAIVRKRVVNRLDHDKGEEECECESLGGNFEESQKLVGVSEVLLLTT
jgi:hypothetical protein